MSLPDTAEYWNDIKSHFKNKRIFIDKDFEKKEVSYAKKQAKKSPKSAKRRKSFCARMGGMKKRSTSAKTARDPDSRINKALRKWNC